MFKTNIYNLLEFRFDVKDGTTISNNTFKEGCCTHNCVNLYSMESNAVINIENNHFYDGDSAIRLAAKNSPKNTVININNNKYDTLSENGKFGLVTIQPWDPKNDDFSGITININNTTKLKDEHVYAFYIGGSESDGSRKFNKHKLPHVYVDGVEQVINPIDGHVTDDEDE